MQFDVVFVSNTGRVDRPYYDPSVRYRAFNPAEYLRRQGLRVTLMGQATFEQYSDDLAASRAIVFHRPNATEAMLRYVTRNAKRKLLIADYDDLIFDVSAAPETPAVMDRGEPVAQVARSLASNAEIGSLFGKKTASTIPLAQAAKSILGGEIAVVHNALDPIYLDIARTLLDHRLNAEPEYDLAYFSGTASHNKDLATISPVIADYLDERRYARLLLVGLVALPDDLHSKRDRINRLPVRPFHALPALLIRCRMALGPLVRNQFTDCKSGLKFFESAVLGTPVAATPVPDVDRFESPLLFKCRTADDWAAAFWAPPLVPAAMAEAAREIAREIGLDRPMATFRDTFMKEFSNAA